jgi:DNA polymerase III epsilon subunit family exonuclease
MPTPTDAQRAAIEAPLGPVLVVAGPGAGKTFCLIERIGHLIDALDIEPARICAVTFTNKAADEIAARLRHSLGRRADGITRGTLHALCTDLLRDHGGAVGVERGFGIAEEVYQRLVLRRIGIWQKRTNSVLNLFARRRLENLQLSRSDERSFQRYVEHLRARNMLDFDDLIAMTAELLTTQHAVRAEIAGRWDYLLVDEFQDLNPAQYSIVKALSSTHRNVFAVGDDEQSIFSWTGADPTILRDFGIDFGVEPILLDRNRRCSRQIFDTARRLLAVNEPLFAQKDIVADRASAHDVRALAFPDDERETQWIIGDITADRTTSGRDWGEYAILYRTHRVGHELESRFVRAGVPCRLARGRSLKDDPIIGYVVAGLQLMRSPDDQVLTEKLGRLLLPEPLIDDVLRTMKDGTLEFLPAVQMMARQRPASDPDRAKLWRFVYEVQNLIGLPRMHDDLMGIVTELLAKRVGPYRNVLEEHHDELVDPAEIPEIRTLAVEIESALAGRREVRVPVAGGLGIATKALLLAGGITTVALGDDDAAAADTLRIDASPHAVFKALQLVHARDIGNPLSDYVSFDLETTDDDVAACEIVEIGAVRVRHGSVTEEFHTLVKPDRPVSEAARKVHGYDESDLMNAPCFVDVWPSFRAFVGGDVLVAHNGVRFDVPVLERMAQGLPSAGDLAFYDSYLLARELLRSSHRLTDLAERFGVPIDRAHHALDDARALAGVFGALTDLRIARARKTSLTNLLDWLAIGLALDTRPPPEALAGEHALLQNEARIFALGRYSDALERYTAERALLEDDAIPTTDDLIATLGGRALMERLRSERTAEQRYPEAIARLRQIADSVASGRLTDTIDEFLERLTLTTSEGADVDRYRVNLLTLHSTKGLEFPCVYVVGVEDYQLPGYYPTVDNRAREIEEARRLLYVGMTRAEDRLVLTRASERGGSNSGGSRFLDEMGLTPERRDGTQA